MSYALVPFFSQKGDYISVPPERYTAIRQAKQALVATIGVEQRFDLLVENYLEYESELLNIAMRLMVFHDSKWFSLQHDNLRMTRRLVNLLSAARLYLDHLDHDLGRIFEDPGAIKAAIKEEKAARYDSAFGFRLMETLRNSIQHRTIAGVRLQHNYGEDLGDIQENDDRVAAAGRRRVAVRVSPIFDVSELHDMGLKGTVAKEIERGGRQQLDVTLHVREYVEGLATIHFKCRALMRDHRTQWELAIRQALESGKQRWPEDRSRALKLMEVGPGGETVEWTYLFVDFLDYLKAFEEKNREPFVLANVYVSNNCAVQ